MSPSYQITNEASYHKELTDFFRFFLNCDMMQIDINKATVAEIESCIQNYDPVIVNAVGTWCSWLEIGSIHSYLNDYGSISDIELLTPKGEPLILNFSQFRYKMSPRNNGPFPVFDPHNATLINTIDDEIIDPSVFFPKHKGEKILYLSSVNGVTKFNKTKTVYRFAFKKIQCPDLCEYIRQTQINVLKNFLSYSVSYPSTVVDVLGTSGSHHQHFYKTRVPEIIDFAKKVFDMEYRNIFVDKLSKIGEQGLLY